jgi:HflK protein
MADLPPNQDDIAPLGPVMDGADGPHMARARDFVLPLTAAAVALMSLALYSTYVAGSARALSLTALSLLQGFTGITIGLAAVLARHRRRVFAARLEWADIRRERARREAEGARSLFSSQAEADPRGVPERKLVGYGHTVQPLTLLLLGIATGTLAVRALRFPVAPGTDPILLVMGLVNLAVAFLCLIGARWFSAQPTEALPEGRGVGFLLGAVQSTSVLGALGLFATQLQAPVVDLWVGRLLLVLALALASEQAIRAGTALLNRAHRPEAVRSPIELLVAESLFLGANPIASALAMLEDRAGVNIRSSYVLSYIRRAIPITALAVALLFWVTTSLVCVEPYEVGIHSRFGKLLPHPLVGPGLHLVLPWPIDRVDRISAGRVQTAGFGHDSPEALRYVLWSSTHAPQEYKLVLGEGRELVSLDTQVFYQIKDPVSFTLSSQNPLTMLHAFGYRSLMRETVSTDLDHLLSEDRTKLSDRLRDALQRDLDAQSLGIEVIRVAIASIHPPVDVAPAYEAVVSAQIERVRLATRARADREQAIPAAEAERLGSVRKAQADAATRLAAARGESIRFNTVQSAYRAGPEAYRERLWQETLEEAVAGKRLFLVEGKGSTSREYWVDCRKGSTSEPSP